ncbi:sigma-70 family RNA polymerase sigma factor [Mucilaginibacter sp.]|uniref:RNA polymerase sigma factor n=1 Tax=Mucilaginibacter sp. TaxID=1882438 RepID=UPI00263803AB|nr:sigma-70 family RNA polymerase sigma factor [Mucilaginibacter sp.]MDB4925988.1 polymerase sigma-70 factor [Mucilaginibacter sp.]
MKILEETYQKDLLVRLSQGDETAFNAIYQAYSKPMYRRIMYLVKNMDVADEVLQELFIKLWINRVTLDTDKSFQSYMFTVAQNLVYNYFRKIASDQSLIQSLSFNSVNHYLNGEELLENKQAAQLLHQAIDQLTPQRKQVFSLCKLQGKSYEETSRIMGISTATVNSHMTKSIQSIKDYLLKHQDVAFLLMWAYLLK